MLSKQNIVIPITILFLICRASVFSQDERFEFLQVKFLYEELRFDEAIGIGQKLIIQNNLNRPEALELVHQYLALSFYNIGKIDSARVHFLSLLSINPEIQLNPVETSPKIIEFFEKIRQEQNQFLFRDNLPVYHRYIVIEDRRPSAAWRSAILPGWGQFYKNQKTKGLWLGGAFGGSILLTISSAFLEDKYKDDYNKAVEPSLIKEKYNLYNNWSKTRRLGTYFSIALWIFSFTDAIWTAYPELNLEGNSPENISVNISVPLPSFLYP